MKKKTFVFTIKDQLQMDDDRVFEIKALSIHEAKLMFLWFQIAGVTVKEKKVKKKVVKR